MNHRILTIAGALLCASLIETGDAAELITLRYGQNASSAGSLSSLPLAVAERKGFFIREGLKLDVFRFPAARIGSLRHWTKARSMPARMPRLT